MSEHTAETSAAFSFSEPVSNKISRAPLALALVTVGIGSVASYFTLFHYRPGGGMFPGIVAPIILGLFSVAAVVTLRFKTLGGLGCIAVVAAATPMIYRQLHGWQALLMVGGLGLSAVLLIAVGIANRGRVFAAFVIVVAFIGSVVAFAVVWDYYQARWGPLHPQSTAELEPSEVLWVWSGGISSDTARVTAKAATTADLRLAYSVNADFAASSFVDPDSVRGDAASFSLNGLDPNTEYFYSIEVDGRLDTARTGRFTTFPVGPASFRLAFGACSRTGSNGSVFETIQSHDPLVYLISGDFFYGDIPENNVDRFDEIFDTTLTVPAQSELYRSTGIAYVWDDHDYGPNNSDSRSPGREAALASYRNNVPSYALAGPTAPIYQAFTVGRVRVIMIDQRSARIGNETMLGLEQKAWLTDELVESAKSHALVIWLNPVPWIGDSGDDYWAEFPDERAEIAQVIADNDIKNLVMVSGDAHMVALDDGTNSNYSTDPGKGFPVLHVAALDRPGSTRGGPYSHGKFAGSGQFGLVEVIDDGDSMSVTLEGRNWKDDVITSLVFEPELPSGFGQ